MQQYFSYLNEENTFNNKESNTRYNVGLWMDALLPHEKEERVDGKVKRYQKGNQKPEIEGQTPQWPK
jgi:hypothetical protein